MFFRRTFIFVAFLASFGAVYAFAADAAATLSIQDYIAELDRLSAITNNLLSDPKAGLDAAKDLPPTWNISVDGRTFPIDTEWIQGELEEGGEKPTENIVTELQHKLAELKADAEAFEQSPPDIAPSRAKLNAILAQPEFRHVHGQTWLDRLKQWIGNLILKTLERLFGSTSIPIIGRVLVWTLGGFAVLALAFWIYKTLKRNAGIESFMPEVVPVSAKQWFKWMAEAQAAAAAGKWRDAVHLAYWAGISFLEERGMWRPDKARTPREYLRLLSPSSEYRGALSSMTREFEVVWYGYKQAGPESYSQALAYLENLGCRPS
jgi:hypothetical protein